jgi:hypothetical protein
MTFMTEAEWFAEMQKMAPDLARIVVRTGLVVDGVRRFPPRRLVPVPDTNSPPKQ